MRGLTSTGRGSPRLGAALLALILVSAGPGTPVAAKPAVIVTPASPEWLNGSFTLTVDCAGAPERTTLTNNLAGTPLNLSNFTLGSIVAPRGGEPFRLSGTLASGESRTYETGPGAAVNPLSAEAIYEEADPREGARLTGFASDLVTSCSGRTNTRGWRADPPVSRLLPTAATPHTGGPGGFSPEAAGSAGSPTTINTPAPAGVATPRLPAAGAGGHTAPSWLSPLILSLGLLLVAFVGACVIRRRI